MGYYTDTAALPVILFVNIIEQSVSTESKIINSDIRIS
jgi:hypothetical protein